MEELVALIESEGVEKDEARDAAKEAIQAMDLDGDSRVDYYEFLSYSLGRRKKNVEVIFYDISKGASKRFSRVLLGRGFEAIYHSAVIVFGYEIWFGGALFMNEPPTKDLFGPPLEDSSSQLTMRPSFL